MSAALALLRVVAMLLLTVVNAPTIANAMRAAIRPYSMAVAPDSSIMKFLIMVKIVTTYFTRKSNKAL